MKVSLKEPHISCFQKYLIVDVATTLSFSNCAALGLFKNLTNQAS